MAGEEAIGLTGQVGLARDLLRRQTSPKHEQGRRGRTRLGGPCHSLERDRQAVTSRCVVVCGCREVDELGGHDALAGVGIFVDVPKGENVRQAGEDVPQGALILARGSEIRPPEVGMLAALGHKEAPVNRRPRVAILSTGDEVIEVDAPWQPGKIRNANSYSNAAQVQRYGGVPLLLGIARDDVERLTAKIRAGLEQGADLFLTSGGVSVGDFDVVKEVLAAEGEMGFWRVRMKPGKPLAFGRIRGVPLLGLPGDPVSAMVSFELFARPAILKMLGGTRLDRPGVEAILLDAITRKDDRRHYLRVSPEERDGEYLARLTGDHGSGILLSMVRAQGLAIIPEDVDHLPAGARVQVLLLD